MTDPGPPATGDSALLVAIPAAEAVIGRLRLAHDAVAAQGIPAHVTVLFPFVPRRQLTNEVRHAITDVFSSFPAFDYRFERVARFGDTTVYLAPEPAVAFSRLTDAVQSRWPDHPPYGGVYEVVVPHLTVGDDLDRRAADALEATASRALASQGPIVGRAMEVALMIMDAESHWSVAGRYPLGLTR